MARRSFFEHYQKEKQDENRERAGPAVIRQSAMSAAIDFLGKLFSAVFHIAAAALSSVGLTTLINKPLREMLFALARSTFFGN
jgi:hypothetical protein